MLKVKSTELPPTPVVPSKTYLVKVSDTYYDNTPANVEKTIKRRNFLREFIQGIQGENQAAASPQSKALQPAPTNIAKRSSQLKPRRVSMSSGVQVGAEILQEANRERGVRMLASNRLIGDKIGGNRHPVTPVTPEVVEILPPHKISPKATNQQGATHAESGFSSLLANKQHFALQTGRVATNLSAAIQATTFNPTSTIKKPVELCTLCSAQPAEVVLQPCGHGTMCEQCISSWLLAHPDRSCPLCRQPTETVLRVKDRGAGLMKVVEDLTPKIVHMIKSPKIRIGSAYPGPDHLSNPGQPDDSLSEQVEEMLAEGSSRLSSQPSVHNPPI